MASLRERLEIIRERPFVLEEFPCPLDLLARELANTRPPIGGGDEQDFLWLQHIEDFGRVSGEEGLCAIRVSPEEVDELPEKTWVDGVFRLFDEHQCPAV